MCGLYNNISISIGGEYMIKYVKGNLLESEAECLVNTVNCEGVMGKGIAYQFKLRFPENNRDYIKACKSGALVIGKLHYWKEDGKVIINFPTKDTWRKKSEIEFIEKGLNELVVLIPKLGIKSIAIPALGCGNGGLQWGEVKKLILNKIEKYENDYDFLIYEPSHDYVAKAKEAPKLSLSALVLMNMKLGLNKFNTLRLQKTAYFMNVFLQDKYFKFQKHKFGPYDNSIAIINKNIKAFQVYYNVNDTREAYNIAYNTIVSNQLESKLKVMEPAMKKSINLVNSISNDSFLECIATITYLVEVNKLESKAEIVKMFKLWSEDKDRRFSEEDILEGIDYLVCNDIISETLIGYGVN